MTAAERRRYGKEFERINRSFEVKYFTRVNKALKKRVSSLIANIRSHGLQSAYRSLHTDVGNLQLNKIVKELYLEVGLRYARKEYRRQLAEIRSEGKKSISHKLVLVKADVSTPADFQTKGFGFNATWTAFILNYLKAFLLEKITFKVDETTKRKLLSVVQEAIAEGWGIDETVKKLDDLPFIPYQAARIVRTEINRAANVGTMAGVDTSEYEMNKEWIAGMDRRTRGNPMTGQEDHANHWAFDGQVIDFNDKFRDSRNGDLLSFPGDPKASAASTVNCRCSVAPVAKRNAQGRLVPKPQVGLAPILGITRPPIAASPNIGVRVSNG